MATKNQLSLIHFAKAQMRLTDCVYRDILYCLFKAQSSKELNNDQVRQLLDHFKTLGWESKPRKKKYSDLDGRDGFASAAQLRLLEFSWNSNPAIRNKSESALRNFIHKKFKTLWPRCIVAAQIGPILKSIRSIR